MSVSNVFAAVAAAAALVALWFAWRTVRHAEDARREAQKEHESEMSAQREANEASAAARHAALAAECALERLRQLDRLAEIVLTITNVALDEIEHPPHPVGGLSTSRLPPLLGRIHVALAVLRSLDGPTLQATFTLATTDSGKEHVVFSHARLAVPEIQAAAGFDEHLGDLVTQSEARAKAARPS